MRAPGRKAVDPVATLRHHRRRPDRHFARFATGIPEAMNQLDAAPRPGHSDGDALFNPSYLFHGLCRLEGTVFNPHCDRPVIRHVAPYRMLGSNPKPMAS